MLSNHEDFHNKITHLPCYSPPPNKGSMINICKIIIQNSLSYPFICTACCIIGITDDTRDGLSMMCHENSRVGVQWMLLMYNI